jgi:hypothetical protein
MGTLMRHVTAVASPCAGKVVMVVVVVVVKFQYLCIGNRLAIPSNSSSPSQSKNGAMRIHTHLDTVRNALVAHPGDALACDIGLSIVGGTRDGGRE